MGFDRRGFNNSSGRGRAALTRPARSADCIGEGPELVGVDGVAQGDLSIKEDGRPKVSGDLLADGKQRCDRIPLALAKREFALDFLKSGAPLGTTLEPEDLTGTAVYLASEDSRLMTGQTLVVDAGVWMNG